MSAQSKSTRSAAERAFVIQFDAIPDERAHLRGRVEQVASGEATHFRTLEQLVAFMMAALRRQAATD
jgi:hypothetical protein